MAAHITEEGWLINGQDCGFTGNYCGKVYGEKILVTLSIIFCRTEHIRSSFVPTAMRFQNADNQHKKFVTWSSLYLPVL